MQSQLLIETLIAATGLPEHLIRKEFAKICQDSGCLPEEIDMDSLRKVIADYLRRTLLKAKEENKKAGLIEDVGQR